MINQNDNCWLFVLLSVPCNCTVFYSIQNDSCKKVGCLKDVPLIPLNSLIIRRQLVQVAHIAISKVSHGIEFLILKKKEKKKFSPV